MKLTTTILSTLLLSGAIASAQTLVKVNGKAITQQEVETELMNATQGRFNQVPEDKQAEFRQQVLQQLIGKELIYSDAKKIGIVKSDEYKEEYKKLEERMKKELAIQVWQKKLLDDLKISDKELKEYYNNNKEEFSEKEAVHARHILVKTEDEAKSVISQLKSLKAGKLKEKFIELAKEKSTGPSGPKGGDLGYFGKGQMVPEFNDAVFSMKVGTISQSPVETQFGFHVIYLEDKKEASVRKYDDVKVVVQERLKMEKFKTVMKNKMDELQKKATIE